MRLHTFSVTNYRSITAAHKISLSDTTVLVGANNEGKSNIVRALRLAMSVMLNFQKRRRPTSVRYLSRLDDDEFRFERDFPIHLQSRKSGLESRFRLEFELNDQETEDFKNELKINLGGVLKIEIKIGQDSTPKLDTILQGKASKALSEKSVQVCEFISKRLIFNHIPAVRTHEDAVSIIRGMIISEFRELAQNPDYKSAVETLERLRQPVVQAIEERIAQQISPFMPNLARVRVETLDETRHFRPAARDINVLIDDGNETPIETKGDGIQSLAALALLKERSAEFSASIIAIEEPESHLHPAAMHEIQRVIYDLGKENQVIISTHNPIFVDRMEIKSNIIVRSGKAISAKSISEIRNVLGIEVSDNLQNTRLALVVEGPSDQKVISRFLSDLDLKYKTLLRDGELGFHHLGGGSKLSYHLQNLKNSVCEVVVLCDNDEAVRKDVNEVILRGLVDGNKTFLIPLLDGRNESELEDCVDPEVYRSAFRDQFGVDISLPSFGSNKKWADRLKDLFDQCGRPWSNGTKATAKKLVSELVESSEAPPLLPQYEAFILELAATLEKVLKR